MSLAGSHFKYAKVQKKGLQKFSAIKAMRNLSKIVKIIFFRNLQNNQSQAWCQHTGG
jgi:hypothetical protein